MKQLYSKFNLSMAFLSFTAFLSSCGSADSPSSPPKTLGSTVKNACGFDITVQSMGSALLGTTESRQNSVGTWPALSLQLQENPNSFGRQVSKQNPSSEPNCLRTEDLLTTGLKPPADSKEESRFEIMIPLSDFSFPSSLQEARSAPNQYSFSKLKINGAIDFISYVGFRSSYTTLKHQEFSGSMTCENPIVVKKTLVESFSNAKTCEPLPNGKYNCYTFRIDTESFDKCRLQIDKRTYETPSKQNVDAALGANLVRAKNMGPLHLIFDEFEF